MASIGGAFQCAFLAPAQLAVPLPIAHSQLDVSGSGVASWSRQLRIATVAAVAAPTESYKSQL